MLVVVDTNVVVSALLSPSGAPAQLVSAILADRVKHAFDVRMKAEFEEVLRRPKFSARIPEHAATTVLGALDRLGILVAPLPYAGHLVDEDDRPFLEVALACGGLLVTGNAKHFPTTTVVRIVSPAEALHLLRL